MKKRAFSQEDKNTKRDKIMAAAMSLLREGHFELPSVSEIIKKAGEAKGTVYLYFQSKEEIYLSAMVVEFQKATDLLLQNLKESRSTTPDIIAEAMIELAQSSPKLVYLAVIAPIVLENNVSDEFIIGFKSGFLTLTEEIATVIHRRDGISKKQAKEKFMLGYNLFIGMYQHSHPPQHVQKIIEAHNLAGLQYDFVKKYTETLKKIWD